MSWWMRQDGEQTDEGTDAPMDGAAMETAMTTNSCRIADSIHTFERTIATNRLLGLLRSTLTHRSMVESIKNSYCCFLCRTEDGVLVDSASIRHSFVATIDSVEKTSQRPNVNNTFFRMNNSSSHCKLCRGQLLKPSDWVTLGELFDDVIHEIRSA